MKTLLHNWQVAFVPVIDKQVNASWEKAVQNNQLAASKGILV